jgi:hypothetical protein
MRTLDGVIVNSIIVDNSGNVFFATRDNFATPNGETFSAWHYDKRTEESYNIISSVDYNYALAYIAKYREGEA